MPRLLPAGRTAPSDVNGAIAEFERAYADGLFGSEKLLMRRSPFYKQLIALGFQGQEVVDFMPVGPRGPDDVEIGGWEGPRAALSAFCTMMFLEHGEWLSLHYYKQLMPSCAWVLWRPKPAGRTLEQLYEVIERTYEALPPHPSGIGRAIPTLCCYGDDWSGSNQICIPPKPEAHLRE